MTFTPQELYHYSPQPVLLVAKASLKKAVKDPVNPTFSQSKNGPIFVHLVKIEHFFEDFVKNKFRLQL